jgi:uncharacterized membrane protein YphA (DoxX/SURF4 family)
VLLVSATLFHTKNLIIMELDHKKDKHQSRLLVLLRVILGFILFWKGIMFIQDSSRLELMIQHSGFSMLNNGARVLAFIIPYVSLLGGLFIASGLFTRWTAIVQIPILIGAVIFANTQ